MSAIHPQNPARCAALAAPSHLKENTSYAIHVLAVPAAAGQQPTTVYVTTK
jgi:hypothetical protein